MTCKDYGKMVVKMLRAGVDSMPCSGCGEDVSVPMHIRKANSKLEWDNTVFLNKLKSELGPKRDGR